MFILLYALKNQPLPFLVPQCFWKPIWSSGALEIKWEVSMSTFLQRESPNFHQVCKGTPIPKAAPGLHVSVIGYLGEAHRISVPPFSPASSQALLSGFPHPYPHHCPSYSLAPFSPNLILLAAPDQSFYNTGLFLGLMWIR